ncbi:MAG: tetratricopeptide repeat protein, partial [Synechococcales bacterium]|nr:tetratricopeptide repeat protein [Synechococcales bacterium]
EAIRIDPNYTNAYYNRGIVKDALGDSQGAIADYTETLRIDPEYANAYYNRGNTYELLNENGKAIADFKNAAVLYKKNEDTTWFNKASQRIRTLEQSISQGEQTGTSSFSSGVATIYDPPSNIRVRPNGRILCSVPTKGALISIQGQEGKWYRTDHCGSPGFIHRSQVRF